MADLGSARGEIRIDFDGSGIAAATKSLTGFDAGTKNVGANLTKIGGSMAGLGAVIGAPFAIGIKSAADFEQQLSGIAAVGGADAVAAMDQIREAALQMGADTSFSASEAASGMEELVKAGLPVKDVLDGAAQGALDLAAATGSSVPQAAQIMGVALNVFGESMVGFNTAGEQAVHVADLFAASAAKTNADVDGLAQALGQSALVAEQFGFGIEETIGVLSAFADAGLKGSDAGTSLKTALLAIGAPSSTAAAEMAKYGIEVRNADGSMKSAAGIAGELALELGGLTSETRDAALETIFGADAIRAANILYEQGASGIASYTALVDDQGAAQEQAAIRLDNFKGTMEQLTGSLETAAIALGTTFLPALRTVAEGVTKLVNVFLELPAGVQTTIAVFGGLSSVFLLVAGGALLFAGRIAESIKAIQALRLAMSGLTLSLGPVGLALAVAAAVAALVIYIKSSGDAETQSEAAARGVQTLTRALLEQQAVGLNTSWGQSVKKDFESVLSTGTELKTNFDTVSTAYNKLADTTEGILGITESQSNVVHEASLAYNEQALSVEQTDRATAALNTIMGYTGENMDAVRHATTATNAEFRSGRGGAEGYTRSLETIAGNLDILLTALPAVTDETTAAGAAAGTATDATLASAKAYQQLGVSQSAVATIRQEMDEAAAAAKALEQEAAALANTFRGKLGQAAVDTETGMVKLDGSVLGLAATLGIAEDSALGLFREMEKLGSVEGGGDGGALDIAAGLQATADALDDVLAKFAVLDDLGQRSASAASIATSLVGAPGEWALLDDMLVNAQNNAANLVTTQADLARSTDIYTDAVAAGYDILASDAAIQEDLNWIRAQQLPTLAKQTEAYATQINRLAGLNDAEQSHALALMDSGIQAQVTAAYSTAYAASLGEIPKSVATDIIANAAAADPILAGVLETMGLIDVTEATGVITVTLPDASQTALNKFEAMFVGQTVALDAFGFIHVTNAAGSETVYTQFGELVDKTVTATITPVWQQSSNTPSWGNWVSGEGEPEPIDIPVTATLEETAIADITKTLTDIADATYAAKVTLDTAGFTTPFGPVRAAIKEVEGKTFTATLTADKGPFDEAYAAVNGGGAEFEQATYTATLGADRGSWDEAYAAVNGGGAEFDGATYTATLAGDYGPWNEAYAAVNGGGADFDEATYAASLDGDASLFDGVLRGAISRGDEFGVIKFQADFTADSALFDTALGAAITAGDDFGDNIYTATLAVKASETTVDPQTVIDGIATQFETADYSGIGTNLATGISTALSTAIAGVDVGQGGGGPAVAGGIGAGVVTAIGTAITTAAAGMTVTGLGTAVAAAALLDVQAADFAPVGAAIQTKISESFAAGSAPSGGSGAPPAPTAGAGGIGAAILATILGEITAADFTPVGTAIQTKIGAAIAATTVAVTTSAQPIGTAINAGTGVGLSNSMETPKSAMGAVVNAVVAKGILSAATANTIGTELNAKMGAGLGAATSTPSTAMGAVVSAVIAKGVLSAAPANTIGTELDTKMGAGLGASTSIPSAAMGAVVSAVIAKGVLASADATTIGTEVDTKFGAGLGKSTSIPSIAIGAVVDAAIAAGVLAAADATTIGAALSQGMADGITSGPLATAMGEAVAAGIAAGMAAAGAKSPSTKARDQIGLPLLQGIVVGIKEGTPEAIAAMRTAVDSLFARQGMPLDVGGSFVPPAFSAGARSGGGSSSTVNHGSTYTVNIDGATVASGGDASRVGDLIRQLVAASGVAVDVAHAGSTR